MREISTNSGFSGQSSLRASFGLARAEQVDELRIEWPSGIITEMADVAANQFLTIVEDSTATSIDEEVDQSKRDQNQNDPQCYPNQTLASHYNKNKISYNPIASLNMQQNT